MFWNCFCSELILERGGLRSVSVAEGGRVPRGLDPDLFAEDHTKAGRFGVAELPLREREQELPKQGAVEPAHSQIVALKELICGGHYFWGKMRGNS